MVSIERGDHDQDTLGQARGLSVTHARALAILRAHGMGAADVAEFYQDEGRRERYSARRVYLWLGY